MGSSGRLLLSTCGKPESWLSLSYMRGQCCLSMSPHFTYWWREMSQRTSWQCLRDRGAGLPAWIISKWVRNPEGWRKTLVKTEKETQIYRTVFWNLWEKARVGCFRRTASKHVYYLGWNRSPAQVGCMRQALRPGALGRPRGSGWRGRWVGGSGWGTHVNPWLFHFNVWQNSLQVKNK